MVTLQNGKLTLTIGNNHHTHPARDASPGSKATLPRLVPHLVEMRPNLRYGGIK